MSEKKPFNIFIKDVESYQPDTLDLNTDDDAAEYWFPCLYTTIEKIATQAANSERDGDATADERAERFKNNYKTRIEEYCKNRNANAANNEKLGVRELLGYIDTHLRICGFEDPWFEQKKSENEMAHKKFEEVIKGYDDIKDERQKWIELVRGVLAGNMFDWGAKAVSDLMKQGDFTLDEAISRIQQRPWLIDDLDKFLLRLQGEKHKCAAVFVDNSGPDILLGMLPFVRQLLKRDTKVILCANTVPCLNDVTTSELTVILEACECKCPVLKEARANNKLLVFANGQNGPCLDMRLLPKDLCEVLQKYETDLLVIEGMGRAIHTNLYSSFNCETLKLAVVKNQWLARRLGGETFAGICKYEPLS